MVYASKSRVKHGHDEDGGRFDPSLSAFRLQQTLAIIGCGEWRLLRRPRLAWDTYCFISDSVFPAISLQGRYYHTMSTSPPDANARSEQPHLVSLVLQSKKALQHGEQLCTRARTVSSESAQTAIDLMALDAKLKWVTEAVVEQLKVRESKLIQF